MSQSNPEKPAARKSGVLKWIVRALLAVVSIVVVAVLLVGIALATGIPQQRLLEGQLGKTLKADVKASGISIMNPLRIAGLKAFDKSEGADAQTPMIDLTGLSMAYTLFPKDGRYVASASVDKLALHVDRSHEAVAAPGEPGKPGSKAPSKPPKPKKSRWDFDTSKLIPQTVDLATLDVGYALPYLGVELDGLKAKAAIESKRDYSVQVQGDHLNGSFWAGARDAKRELKDAAINVAYETGKKGTRVGPLTATLPGVLELDGGGVLKEEDGKTVVDIHLEKGLMQDIDLYQAASGAVSFPCRFKKLDLSGTAIRGFGKAKGLKVNASFDGTVISAIGEGLALGPKDHEYYEGNLALTGRGGGGDQLRLDLEAVLNQGQKIAASLSGKEVADMNVRVGLESWSRGDLLAALPKDARGALDAMPGLQAISSSIELQLAKELTYVLKANVTPKWVESDGQPVDVSMSFDATGPLVKVAIEQAVQGMLRLQRGEQTVTAATRIGMNRISKAFQFDCKAELQQWEPRAWVKTFVGQDVLAPLDLRLDGTLTIAIAGADQSVKVQLTGVDLTALSQALPVLGLSGKADSNIELSRDASGLKTFLVDVSSTGPISIDANTVKALMALGKASDDAFLKGLAGKEGACALDGMKLHIAKAASGIEGKITLTGDKTDHNIDLQLDPSALAGLATMVH